MIYFSDAQFLCPGSSLNRSCGAKNLSFDDFFLGICCETASKWTDSVNNPYDKVKKIQLLFERCDKNVLNATKNVEKIRRDVNIHIERVYDAPMVNAKAEIALRDEKISLENAQKAFEESKTKIVKAEEISKKRKARMMILFEEMLKAERKSDAEEQPDKNSCNVCLENYSLPDRQECALPCGHRFCYKCLCELQQKTCPTCRKNFSVAAIYKLF